jgi:branched-chain amino acid transport system substrate-binding protein
MKNCWRKWFSICGAIAFGVCTSVVHAQQPIKIGFGISQTGSLSGAGTVSLLALQIWAEDVNVKGGLLGRKVELIHYDDQSNGANEPAIYSKLLDVDKVDFIVGPTGTVLTAPIIGLAKQRGLLLMGNLCLDENTVVQHDMWFNNAPWNSTVSFSEGFFSIAKNIGATTIAFLAADQESSQNMKKGAISLAKQIGLRTVYEQNYPASTVDFSSMLEAIRATKPDIVFVMAYPRDSVAIVRAVNEIGVGESVKLIGGGMTGLQYAANMESLGSMLNGFTNFNTFVPARTMEYVGVKEFLSRYSKKAVEAKVDPLGYYQAPFVYAIGQMLEQAINATKSLNQKVLADYMHKNELKTVVGPIRYGPDGEWIKARVITIQFRGIMDNNVDQFRQTGKQVIVAPTSLKTGDVIVPFEKASK